MFNKLKFIIKYILYNDIKSKNDGDISKYYEFIKSRYKYMKHTNQGKHYKYKNMSEFFKNADIGRPLENHGFHHMNNDYTKWHKLSGDILYSIIFYMDYRLSIYYRAQPIHDYILIPYKDHKYYIEEILFNECESNDNYYAVKAGVFREGLIYKNSLSEFWYKKITESLNFDIETVVLPYLESIKNFDDIATDTRSCKHLDRKIPALYLSRNLDILKKALMSYKSTVEHFDKALLVELTHDYSTWKTIHRQTLYKSLIENDVSVYDEYLERCKKFNIELLQRNAPELFI